MGIVVDEVPVSADNLRYFAGAARNLEGKAAGEYMRGLHLDDPPRARSASSAQIAPWNYPLMMAVWKIGPALAAGNTHRPEALRADAALDARARRARAEIFPAGVLNVVTGDGEPVGDAASSRHPDVRMVSLTGDVATGKDDRRGTARATRSSASTSSSAARRR